MSSLSTVRRDFGNATRDTQPANRTNVKPSRIYSPDDEQPSHEEHPHCTSQPLKRLKIDHLNPEDLLIIKSSFECKSGISGLTVIISSFDLNTTIGVCLKACYSYEIV